MKKLIKLDKIGSVLKNLPLQPSTEITKKIQSQEGEVIVAKALESQKRYGEIELVNGQISKVKKGNVIAGVLGQRKALEGIVGVVPEHLKPSISST